MDLSIAHLTPASQAKEWIKKIQNFIDNLDEFPFGAEYCFSPNKFFSKTFFWTIPFLGRFKNMLKTPFDNYINYNLSLKAVCFK